MRKTFFVIFMLSLFFFKSSAGAIDKDTLVVAYSLDLKSADPYMASGSTWEIASLWSDRLLGRDLKTGIIKPHLAESWRQVDNLTLEVKLRKGIRFHNGELFDAKAVKITLEWYKEPANKSFMLGYLRWIDRVDIIDSSTVRIISKNLAPLAILVLADAFPIYPPEYFKKVGPEKFGNEPIGTGPYKFVRWKKGAEIEFTRNEEYFGGVKGKPLIKNFIFRIIPEEATRVAELLSGGVHITYDLSPEQIIFLEKTPNIRISKVKEARTYFLFMDVIGRTGQNPFQKLKVRQAIAHAIDTDAIVRDLMRGLFHEAKSIVSPVCFGYEPNVKSYPYNPKKAKELLTEAGYPNGFETDLTGFKEKAVAEAIMGYLDKVGIKVNLKWYGGQWPALHSLIKGGKVNFGFQTFFVAVRDAERMLSLFLESKGELSYNSFPEVDKWLQEAASTIDQKRRQELLSKVQQFIADNALFIPIMGSTQIFAFNEDLDYQPSDFENAFFAVGWKK